MGMTKNAKEFVEANKTSGVYKAHAIGNGGQGGVYTLDNEETFTLTREELVSMPRAPRWTFEEAVS